MDRIKDILEYWFGPAEVSMLPSEQRNRLWFGGELETDKEIRTKFYDDYMRAMRGDYIEWENSPQGVLALILLFDQFSRNIYRELPNAFAMDQKALDLCLRGIERQYDHLLSLIERVFFYFPLMHSESIDMQAISVRAYQMLVNLAFPETKVIFEKFLDYAVKHYEIIEKFGRFPHRNKALGRISTDAEIEFISATGNSPF